MNILTLELDSKDIMQTMHICGSTTCIVFRQLTYLCQRTPEKVTVWAYLLDTPYKHTLYKLSRTITNSAWKFEFEHDDQTQKKVFKFDENLKVYRCLYFQIGEDKYYLHRYENDDFCSHNGFMTIFRQNGEIINKNPGYWEFEQKLPAKYRKKNPNQIAQFERFGSEVQRYL